MDNDITAMELNDKAAVEKLANISVEDDKKDGLKDRRDVKKGVTTKKDKNSSTDEYAATMENKIIEGRLSALNDALSKIEKSYGKGAIMRWGDKTVNHPIDVVPTGCMSIDVALGVGGIPRGRIIEIFGPEASGKTTVTLHIIAEIQKMNGIAAFIDAEHALDPVYAKRLGVNVDDLYISQPDNGEQALEIAEQMVRSGAVDVIVIDSVAALVPRSEIEGEMGQATMGVQARLMSQALRKLTAVSGRTNTIIIFTNQLRANISPYGAPETTTGGRALKFYASVRLDIRKKSGDAGFVKEGGKVIGQRTIVKVAKNKVAPPFKSCEFDIIYGQGISYEGDILDVGVSEDVVYKGGSWYSYNEHRLGQGRDRAVEYLRENSEVCNEIANAVRVKLGMKPLAEIKDTSSKEVVPTEAQQGKKSKGKPNTKTFKAMDQEIDNDNDEAIDFEDFDVNEE